MSKDLDSLLRKLEEERKKTFASLQKELENWKKSYEDLLTELESSLRKETKETVKRLVEERNSVLTTAIRELERELSSIQIIPPAIRLIVKTLKIALLVVFPIGFVLGAIGGWMTGKKGVEYLYQRKLSELESIEKKYGLIKPEWIKEWKIEKLRDEQGSISCLLSHTVIKQVRRGNGKSWDVISDGREGETYCVPLDPLHQNRLKVPQ